MTRWLRSALILLALGIPFLLLPRLITAMYAQPHLFSVGDVPQKRVAIVFGAGVRNGSPTPALRDRVATAADLYFAGKAEKLLMSGDNRFVDYNEPQAMKDYALNLGVPAEAIVLDYAGRRTYDTCCRARDIFGVQEAILVTTDYHLPRAIYTCNALDMKVVGVPAEWRFSIHSLVFLSSNLREFPATLLALWDVHISHPLPVLGKPEPIFSSKPTPKATVPPTKAIETPTATPDIAGTVVAISQPKVFASYSSPDGQWRAKVVIYECVRVGSGPDENAYEQLKLIRVDTEDERTIDSQLQYCGGLGAYGLGGLFWSPNSRYFYYTDAREGVPDGCGYWERPIIRLDVTNQSSKYLGGGPLSPDKAKIATWQGQELVVWDVNQGELARARAAVAGAMPGPIAWAPDSQALAYLQITSDCPPSGKSYVVRLDLPGLEHTLLLESETLSFGGVIWDTPNRISLFDETSKRWEFNLATGTLTPDAASLTIEEYPIIAADVDAPYRFELLDHIPDDVLARRAAWREFDPEQHASAMNEKLAPFGYRLVAEPNTKWQDTFYDLYRGDKLLLSDLRYVWPVAVNENKTDFALVAENGPNYTPSQSVAGSHPVVRLLAWEGHWILETF